MNADMNDPLMMTVAFAYPYDTLVTKKDWHDAALVALPPGSEVDVHAVVPSQTVVVAINVRWWHRVFHRQREHWAHRVEAYLRERAPITMAVEARVVV